MAKEALYIPEEHLREVIAVIREGLNAGTASEEVATNLEEWCELEEGYLDSLGEDED